MLLQGGTYGGSIIGCAAANATIDAIEEDGMLDNARERGVQLIQVISFVWLSTWTPRANQMCVAVPMRTAELV